MPQLLMTGTCKIQAKNHPNFCVFWSEKDIVLLSIVESYLSMAGGITYDRAFYKG